jgi:hypothetical protein
MAPASSIIMGSSLSTINILLETVYISIGGSILVGDNILEGLSSLPVYCDARLHSGLFNNVSTKTNSQQVYIDI